MSTISIVVTTYNRDEYLAQALASLREQTMPVHDVVVVDDGGSGNAKAVVDSFGSPFRYVRQPNAGQQAARNLGVREAEGAWISHLDDDDLWLPNRHEELLAAASSGEADAWFSDCVRFTPQGDTAGTLFADFERSHPGYFGGHARPSRGRSVLTPYALERLVPASPFWPSMLLVRKAFAEAVGGWDTRLRGVISEDMEFVYRLFRHGRVGVLWAPTVRYRCHPGNESAAEYGVARGRVQVWRYVHDHPATPEADRQILTRFLQSMYQGLFWMACQRLDLAQAQQAVDWMSPQSRQMKHRLRLAWLKARIRLA